MLDLESLLLKAQTSKFYLWLLNFGLPFVIPFNRPHRFRVLSISSNSITIKLPNIRRNRNHIKGIHACALATLAELTSGMLLISRLNPKKVRLIMKRIEIDYLYQAKTDVIVDFTIPETDTQNIIEVLKSEPTEYSPEVNIYDLNKNHICKAKVYWHLKSWDLVKTKA
jgi:acyl-coenzyme A thioesterase PaaI-like protein